jgi:hypothetical protein
MCLHCQQIWKSEEYQPFPIRMRSAKRNLLWFVCFTSDNEAERILIPRRESIPSRNTEVGVDKFDAMQMFVRVVEKGSFSAVAKERGIGQPAVSKYV